MHLIPTAYAVDLSKEYAFGGINNASDLLNLLTGPAFVIAGLAVTFFVIVGAFRYLASGGNKESIAGARTMIITGIVGLLLLMLAFILLKYIPEALGLNFKYL